MDKGAHPKLLKISEGMKQWCALLEEELSSWPQVQRRPMFGMLAFYRKGRIFAAIPRSRTPERSDSVIFKLQGASPALAQKALAHPRVTTGFMPKAGWIAMELESIEHVHDALSWFAHAYELAGKARQKATDLRGTHGPKKKHRAC